MSSVDPSMHEWAAVVSVYRDEDVMEKNLLRSPALSFASELHCQSGFASVVKAYNAAIRDASQDVIVFLHPDVYLPQGWHEALASALAWLSERDPSWGVLGLFGCSVEGENRGFTYSTGLGKFVGTPFSVPVPARTVDEFAFVLRKSSGLTFDEALPGPQSQLCATDLCLQAEQRGLGVHVVPCFALHNSNGWSSLPMDFWRPYLYVRSKWRSALPIRVPYARITRSCLPMVRNTLRNRLLARRSGHRTRTRVPDVVPFYESLRADVLRAMGADPEPAIPAAESTRP